MLRLAAVVACFIAIASFALFAVNQTGTASAHQQKVLNGEAPAPSVAGEPNAAGEAQPGSFGLHRPGVRSRPAGSEHEGSPRKLLDEASEALASPFSGLLASWSSEWTERTERLRLVLVVYGFGLGFLARVLRVRT